MAQKLIFFNSAPLDNQVPFMEKAPPYAQDDNFTPYIGWVIEQFFYCLTSNNRRIISCRAKNSHEKFFYYMNCFGFAFGSYWDYGYQIYGGSIPTLLEDDFTSSQTPQPADLIAYFNTKGECIHCSRVMSLSTQDELDQMLILEKRGMTPLIFSVTLQESIKRYTYNEEPPTIKFYREQPLHRAPKVSELLEVRDKNNKLFFDFKKRGGLGASYKYF